MTIKVEKLQLAFQIWKPCCFFCSFVWGVTVVEHMSPSNNNAVILCLLVTTLPLYSNSGKLQCYKRNPGIHKYLWTGSRCIAQTAHEYFNIVYILTVHGLFDNVLYCCQLVAACIVCTALLSLSVSDPWQLCEYHNGQAM